MGQEGTIMEMPKGMTLLELARKVQPQYSSEIVAAVLDHEIHDLQNDARSVANVEFITLDSYDGWKIYERSVLFLLITAVHELYPDAELIVKFSANKGLFCEIRHNSMTFEEPAVRQIEKRMRHIVAENRPIRKEFLSREDAVKMFKKSRDIEKANLIAGLQRDTVSIYHCGEYYDYLFGALLPETKNLGRFELDYEPPGVLLRTPKIMTDGKVCRRVPQPKLKHIMEETKQWVKSLSCSYVTDLNRIIRCGFSGDAIRVSEALQEKRIARIADQIVQQPENARLVMIAGPSSSGKTSFAQRLRVQMLVNGLKPVSISLDDYFRPRLETPRNEKGEYDYECLGALDTELFNKHMVELLEGKEIILPRYNFVTGLREWQTDTPLSVTSRQPIIIEGLHGLNEKLSAAVPRDKKFKIFISALTPLNIDAHNSVSTTDARLLRRLVRDYQFRGAHALHTLKIWHDVRAGEEKNIVPFQEEADVMFNSALVYELAILKKYAVPLLERISPDVPEHIEARRLLDLCSYFDEIDDENLVPNNSLLREFIGKSVFFQ